ncbi:Insulin-degrading enzyme [Orchesella cincta]|uniref:Insulin-degrading enzyme n=1 Tax=Orchesella cincta TaxID=48709 RepID=A0A1D2NJ94_ORCCI|nr:Insulin-degrading enzyme [Orchesella cincta]
MAKPSSVVSNIVKSPLDKREYRGVVLPNDMKVFLVSDPQTDKSAASLSVAVGSMNDPVELPGLAHFLEHMLFLGTKKYPEENDYSKFLAENGGSSNAYTARDHTNYYFDVSPKELKGALDRFSQFFISPLFTESATEREVNAVHSEHEKNIPSDTWRSHQMEVGTASLSHPYSRFATGNRDTLWVKPREQKMDVRASLLDFHRQHYSSNIMSLAVLGSETLDELQALVESLFTDVVNTNVTAPAWPENPYGAAELQTKIELVPIKDIRHLSVMFPIPDTTKHYKSSAEGYLSHLIGHEGAGSLLSLLKEKNWVNHLEAGSHVPARGFGTFKVAVDLTADGLKNTDVIIHHMFEYLQMLRDLGPQKWVWEEMRDVNAMLFRFKDKERPQSFVTHISSSMHNFPLTDVLSAGYILTDFKPELITEILEHLVPEKSRVTIVSKEFADKTEFVEEWYGVKYNRKLIEGERTNEWKNCGTNSELKLPPKNEFIPSNFDLKGRDEHRGIVPRIITENPLSRLWFLQDNEFTMPKAVVRVEAFSPLPLLEPLKTNLNHLFVAVVKDVLTEYSYAAAVAGLHYMIVDSVYGIEVVVNGYDHKLGLLLNRVFEKIVDFNVDPQRFEVLKDFYLRTLKNFEDEQPYSHASYYMTYLLRERRWSNQELLNAMEDVTLEKLNEYARDFVSKAKFEWLVHGNVTAKEATDLVNSCQQNFEKRGCSSLLPSQTGRLREINLPEGSNHLFQSEHKTHLSSCAAVLFQTGMQGTRQNVLVELLEHIANEPCFNQLRTKEQLGYIVFTGVRRAHGTQGIQFLVQSDRHPVYVEGRIDNFLSNLQEILNNMTEEEFLQHRNAVFVRKSEKPKKMIDRANLLWNEITLQLYNFERQAVELAELDNVTLEDIRNYFAIVMGPGSKKTKRIGIHVVSMAEGGAGHKETEHNKPSAEQTIVDDVANWKRRQFLYPASSPYVPAPSGNKSKL